MINFTCTFNGINFGQGHEMIVKTHLKDFCIVHTDDTLENREYTLYFECLSMQFENLKKQIIEKLAQLKKLVQISDYYFEHDEKTVKLVFSIDFNTEQTEIIKIITSINKRGKSMNATLTEFNSRKQKVEIRVDVYDELFDPRSWDTVKKAIIEKYAYVCSKYNFSIYAS